MFESRSESAWPESQSAWVDAVSSEQKRAKCRNTLMERGESPGMTSGEWSENEQFSYAGNW